MLRQLCQVFLSFMAYSFLGWVCESIYCSFLARKFVNRGFLTGPVCPIYGVGALLIIAFLTPFQNNLIVLFILGVFITTVLEYLTSVLMEKLFHMRWWDYSHCRFHINGRVCLLNSLEFGALAVVLMLVLHPFVTELWVQMDTIWIYIASALILAVLCADIYISVLTTLQLGDRIKKLYQTLESLQEKGRVVKDRLRMNLEGRLDEFRERGVEISGKGKARIQELMKLKLLHRRIMDAFPHLQSTRYQGTVERLRKALQESRETVRSRRKKPPR